METLIITLGLGFAALWLLVVLPARKQQQKARSLIDSLEVGKHVMLTSGIYGTIDTIDDEHETIELEVSPEVYLSVTKRAVAQVFDDEADHDSTEATEGDAVDDE